MALVPGPAPQDFDTNFRKTFKTLMSDNLSHLETICHQVAELLVAD